MFGMMNDMIGNMVRTLHQPVCIERRPEVAPAVLSNVSHLIGALLVSAVFKLPRWQRLQALLHDHCSVMESLVLSARRGDE